MRSAGAHLGVLSFPKLWAPAPGSVQNSGSGVRGTAAPHGICPPTTTRRTLPNSARGVGNKGSTNNAENGLHTLISASTRASPHFERIGMHMATATPAKSALIPPRSKQYQRTAPRMPKRRECSTPLFPSSTAAQNERYASSSFQICAGWDLRFSLTRTVGVWLSIKRLHGPADFGWVFPAFLASARLLLSRSSSLLHSASVRRMLG